MAWTDYSSTASNLWDASIGTATNASTFLLSEEQEFLAVAASTSAAYPFVTGINALEDSYNIPGFDDGYQPDGTSNPISGDMGGGGGGGVRPSSGFLYPRGDS